MPRHPRVAQPGFAYHVLNRAVGRVLRYIERNALRANLVALAEDWRWSSLPRRLHAEPGEGPDAGPLGLPKNWRSFVNRPETEAELERLRRSVKRGETDGRAAWAAINLEAPQSAASAAHRTKQRLPTPLIHPLAPIRLQTPTTVFLPDRQR